ncbi:SPL family radical SAM protein [Heyndrickxia acidicola]|uniref:Radical SAM protein n=1 Tax=Heyndrickxia acidicola TaxID=209389 RepID=A0ABU6MLG7_9BACI|nr:radical SAM protein [Heyndrickxia acidicola]MED1205526.1 radical SAM protein [Heyndrickxia acidicola]
MKGIVSKSILTKGTGVLSVFTHSLNPYSGCAFGCSYCYVRQLPVGVFRDEEWGTWIDIKENAKELLEKELAKARKKGEVRIFMSSSTDPYQPIEYKKQLTRSLLEVMVKNPPDFLLVQTRSPLVARDIDLFKKLGSSVRISMTVETDIDKIRKLFSPSAPPIQARLKALKTITEAGIPTQAAVSPLLPSSSKFPKRLRDATNRAIIDDFFMGDGSRGKRTERLGIRKIYEDNGLESWYGPHVYRHVMQRLKEEFPAIDTLISIKGFEE